MGKNVSNKLKKSPKVWHDPNDVILHCRKRDWALGKRKPILEFFKNFLIFQDHESYVVWRVMWVTRVLSPMQNLHY